MKQQLRVFGKIEAMQVASQARYLPNYQEFRDNEWFVRFVCREDAVAAYEDEGLKKDWTVVWSNNIDSSLAQANIDASSIAVDLTGAQFVELRSHFSKYGRVRAATVASNRTAFVRFHDGASAARAAREETAAASASPFKAVRLRRVVETTATAPASLVKLVDWRVPQAAPPVSLDSSNNNSSSNGRTHGRRDSVHRAPNFVLSSPGPRAAGSAAGAAARHGAHRPNKSGRFCHMPNRPLPPPQHFVPRHLPQATILDAAWHQHPHPHQLQVQHPGAYVDGAALPYTQFPPGAMAHPGYDWASQQRPLPPMYFVDAYGYAVPWMFYNGDGAGGPDPTGQ